MTRRHPSLLLIAALAVSCSVHRQLPSVGGGADAITSETPAVELPAIEAPAEAPTMAARPPAAELTATETVAAGSTATEAPAAELTANFFSTDWLEVPASPAPAGNSISYVTHRAELGGSEQRNYSFCYDADEYTSYWVAYPLCAAHLSTGREESWSYDDSLPKELQTSVATGYGASVSTENYSRNFYARGHQIPNADRNGSPDMMAQTYYSTNMTPQLQNGFNGGIWARLESAVRDLAAESAADTLYVVTGAFIDKSAPVQTIVNKNDRKTLPVPSSYWKAVLKVHRDAAGRVAEAVTVGFWLPHTDLKGHSYTEFVVPVDVIEERTGLDLFVNLPDPLESAAESTADWPAFRKF